MIDQDALATRKISLLMELRKWGVSDHRVLSAIERTPREVFLPEFLHGRAYDNVALPIDCGQTISQPLVVAVMTQALDLEDRNPRCLEIGTGSGYQAAILSRLCRRVYSIERHRDLFLRAQSYFKTLHLTNIVARHSDGSRGWPEQAPIDRIIVTAAAVDVPPVLADQLAEGGVMVVPVGDIYGEQQILQVRRTQDGFDHQSILSVRFVPLIEGNAEEKNTGKKAQEHPVRNTVM